jgi:hypothetical protein
MVTDTFGVKIKSVRNLISNIIPITPSQKVVEALDDTYETGFFSEAERSHGLVYPVLMELNRINNRRIKIYIGRELNVDAKRGLNGECDYLLSFGEITEIIDVPIFSVVEAKKQDIEYGTAQCAAQLIGAQLYNQAEGIDTPFLYGTSTTGDVWRFLKLENNTVYLDNQRYYLKDLPVLLGVLQSILNDSQSK